LKIERGKKEYFFIYGRRILDQQQSGREEVIDGTT
jgi:hypothetical protein